MHTLVGWRVMASAAHVVTARLVKVTLLVGHRWLDLSGSSGFAETEVVDSGAG